MFEQTPDQMKATVWIDDKDSRLADQHGCDIAPGSVTLTLAEAAAFVAQMRKMEPSVPNSCIKRFRSIYRQVASAFGPEFFEEWTR